MDAVGTVVSMTEVAVMTTVRCALFEVVMTDLVMIFVVYLIAETEFCDECFVGLVEGLVEVDLRVVDLIEDLREDDSIEVDLIEEDLRVEDSIDDDLREVEVEVDIDVDGTDDDDDDDDDDDGTIALFTYTFI